jgi:hypothetical protein
MAPPLAITLRAQAACSGFRRLPHRTGHGLKRLSSSFQAEPLVTTRGLQFLSLMQVATFMARQFMEASILDRLTDHWALCTSSALLSHQGPPGMRQSYSASRIPAPEPNLPQGSLWIPPAVCMALLAGMSTA